MTTTKNEKIKTAGAGSGDAREANATSTVKTTVYGWPMVPIASGPYIGELTPMCPKCFSTRILLTVKYPVRGTGSRGQGRLGDPGSVSVAVCRNCGNEKKY